MNILYVFPHPDDESFGPGPAISAQVRAGHQVHLLTLTRGGATSQRFRYNYTVEQMSQAREREMQEVARVLGLASLQVLDFTDSGLKEENPIALEQAIEHHIDRVQPEVLVTYAVHGISGFQDHLVSHAVVKRVYCGLREGQRSPVRRLALFTLPESADTESGPHKLNTSSDEEIDCIVPADQTDMEKGRQALQCYVTYKEVIEKTGIMERLSDRVCFEFFQEAFDPPVTDFSDKL